MRFDLRAGAAGLVAALILGRFAGASAQPVDVRVDATESEAVLTILDGLGSGLAVDEGRWQELFATEPYRRLRDRESAMKRAFTDEDFRKFVGSAELSARRSSLRRTLEAWRKVDLTAAGRRAFTYLPAGASIRAKVFLVIKPQTNSFVWEVSTDPAIFLYVDPEVSAAQLENTVAHELHHIGFATVRAKEGKEHVDARVKLARQWMGAFGEGFATLAAAGSIHVHPHAASKPADRERWDRDLSRFSEDAAMLERFFLDVIDGRLAGEDAVQEKAFTFYGTQGPWYTVGYRMATVIESQLGREELLLCMLDPGRLLASFNRAATARNAALSKRGKGLGGPDAEPLRLFSRRLLTCLGPDALPSTR